MNRLVFIVIVLNGQYLSCALLVKKKKSHKILVSIMKKKKQTKVISIRIKKSGITHH